VQGLPAQYEVGFHPDRIQSRQGPERNSTQGNSHEHPFFHPKRLMYHPAKQTLSDFEDALFTIHIYIYPSIASKNPKVG
jgi:hypothetical protein